MEETYEYEEHLMKMKTIEINGWIVTVYEEVNEDGEKIHN